LCQIRQNIVYIRISVILFLKRFIQNDLKPGKAKYHKIKISSTNYSVDEKR
jgi:hypothetical protein